MAFQDQAVLASMLFSVIGCVLVFIFIDIALFRIEIKNAKIQRDKYFTQTGNLKLQYRTDLFPGFVKNKTKFEPVKWDFFEELRKSTMLEI